MVWRTPAQGNRRQLRSQIHAEFTLPGYSVANPLALEATMSKRVSIKLTKEQQDAVKKATGKDAGELELNVDELEDRIAPAKLVEGI